ncbi:MAG: Calx-beta domain-containing protein [Paludisphaera borealis]|uniref:beta strand repeat-containing protein n=1 Tax=Paludisphaera borealis TaxID=1387353 RepID=UPI002847C4CA|nr:Calx-beta domain-containing protein [Paludisphaera borealis]MDR3619919.1 Calx-beta domain-containing protein [Paludisphaera borealis]
MSPIHLRTPDRDGSQKNRKRRLAFDGLEARRLLATFYVTDAVDSNAPGTLRYAINQANLSTGANDIAFALPASTAPLLDSPAPGFDPTTQVWTIQLQSPLPPITRPLIIDGFSQAHAGVGYRYPVDLISNPPTIHVIQSTANTLVARDGQDAKVRVVLDGSLIVNPSKIGVEVDASQVAIRGMAITGFHTGVQVDQLDPQGNPVKGTLIQGNFIGDYPVYPVDAASTGNPLPSPNNVWTYNGSNSGVGILAWAANTTIGGENPQDSNVITANGLEGIVLNVPATGGVVSGNQIGVMSLADGRYSLNGNGYAGGLSSDGVLVLASSVLIGGTSAKAANVISANAGNGVHVSGATVTETLIASNLIGLAPGGGYLFGTGNPGNGYDGVRIENSATNSIRNNTISSNGGAGVRLMGITATGNTLTGNLIGLTADGLAVKGNFAEGVAVYAPQNTIGAGNVISGNLRGVGVYGPLASGILIQNNLIGTDITGKVDLGNAQEGVLIQDSSDDRILGDAKGGQVISGNLIGISLSGLSTIRTLVQGNFVGTDVTGTAAIPNAHEGVLVLDAGGNTIGGTTPSALNLISGNHWGVRLHGVGTTGDLVEGNIIGADITGKLPIGNEVHGVIVSGSASGNIIGGVDPTAGNIIAFNFIAGVQIVSGVGDAVLSNSIFQNGKIGIDLYVPGDTPSGATPNAPAGTPGPNNLQAHPTLTAALTGSGSKIQGTLVSTPGATFLIQFFSSPIRDLSGFGQGQTLVGTALVTTDATGFAAIDAASTAAISPNAWITATATNVASADTSEFSNSVSAVPVGIQLSSDVYTTTALAGAVLIDVQRVDNPNAIVSVNYATAPGSAPAATAGADYVSASGTLTFQPGEFHKTIRIDLLPNPSRTTTASNISLTLSQPSVGVTLGSPSTATVTINNNLPPTLAFGASTYSTYSTSGSVVVTINRSGADLSTASSVSFATVDGTGVAGVDYTTTAGTASFLPGQTKATFSVPILASASGAGTRTVGLVLSNPAGGATLGGPSVAILNIVTAASPAPGPVDTVPPHVTSQQLFYGPGGVAGMVLGFSKPLDPTRAVDLGNYGYYVYKLGRDGRFGTRDDSYVAIASATYDASRYAVTLTFARGLGSAGTARLVVNGLASSTLNRGVADTSGNLLSGVGDNAPGSPYTTNFSLAAPKPVATVGRSPITRTPVVRAPIVRAPVVRKTLPHPVARTQTRGR